jgi:hypothetical protein
MRYKLSHYDNDTPIEKIHLTYLKLQKRIDERRKNFSDFIKYIPTIIKPTNDKYSIFFKFRDTEVCKVLIEYNNNYGYTYHQDRLYLQGSNEVLEGSNKILEARNERLDYLEDTELKFELGEKFKHLEKLSRNHFSAYFKDVLISKIKNSYFNNGRYDKNIKEIFIINNITYLFIGEYSKNDLINLDEKTPIIIN